MHLAVAKFAYETEYNLIPKTDEDYILEAQFQNSNPRQVGKNTYFSPVDAHDLDAVTRAIKAAESGELKLAYRQVLDAAWYKCNSERWLAATNNPKKEFKAALSQLLKEWL